jgi:radical SAM superfamily enzyme YgiQ (UPF0313 family)
MKKRLLLINPPIYDFTAFNLWARPMGLLYLSSFLKKMNFKIDFIDCLQPVEEFENAGKHLSKNRSRKYSTYKYDKTEIAKPIIFKNVRRKYYRFGISDDEIINLIKGFNKPDAVLVTSIMTYWYPGVIEIIKTLKNLYPDVPVILGGIYATLCSGHAHKFSGADYVFVGNDFYKLIMLFSRIFKNDDLLIRYKNNYGSISILDMYPDYGLYKKNSFITLLTSTGCIYKCKYCASDYLCGSFNPREYMDAVGELKYWLNKFEITDVAFYDDALLYDNSARLNPFLEEVIKSKIKINFHTPNGMHMKFLNKETVSLMKDAGFKTLRFGLESITKKYRSDSDDKISKNEFAKGIGILFDGGFDKDNIGIYVLMGLPGQVPADVYKTIRFVKSFGVIVKLCEYSPIPHTAYFNELKRTLSIHIDKEPLFQNNTALSIWSENFSETVINDIKLFAKET